MSFELNKSLIQAAVNRYLLIERIEPKINQQINYSQLQLAPTQTQPKFISSLFCPCCKSIVWRPHTTICCGITFCQSCLETNKECLNCHHPWSYSPSSEDKIIRCFVDRLVVRCHNLNCDFVGTVDQLSSHLKNHPECSSTVRCPQKHSDSQFCRWIGTNEEYEQHRFNCFYKSCYCISCKNSFPFIYAATHVLTCQTKNKCSYIDCDYEHKAIHLIRHEKKSHR